LLMNLMRIPRPAANSGCDRILPTSVLDTQLASSVVGHVYTCMLLEPASVNNRSFKSFSPESIIYKEMLLYIHYN